MRLTRTKKTATALPADTVTDLSMVALPRAAACRALLIEAVTGSVPPGLGPAASRFCTASVLLGRGPGSSCSTCAACAGSVCEAPSARGSHGLATSCDTAAAPTLACAYRTG
jgi:hypothetical protein